MVPKRHQTQGKQDKAKARSDENPIEVHDGGGRAAMSETLLREKMQVDRRLREH
jgi:hypothetical protein